MPHHHRQRCTLVANALKIVTCAKTQHSVLQPHLYLDCQAKITRWTSTQRRISLELGVNADVKTRAITDQVLLVGVVKSLAQDSHRWRHRHHPLPWAVGERRQRRKQRLHGNKTAGACFEYLTGVETVAS